VEQGAEAIRRGASIAVIGVPVILAADPEAELRQYVDLARQAWAGRG
jgi:orotidine-5'-phosphate decarboxylase